MNKTTVIALVMACCTVTGQAAEEATVKLKLALPKPNFIGTPTTAPKSPNLEPKRTGARPEMMVPAGVTNLAKGKAVTGSDSKPLGDLTYVTDGDKDTVYGDSVVELAGGTQHVQIDLGKSAELYAIVIWHYHHELQPQVNRDVIVQLSSDPEFVKDVQTVFNNDHDNSSGLGIGKDKEYIESFEGKLINARGIKGRYVRVHNNGSTANELNRFVEIEVYGK